MYVGGQNMDDGEDAVHVDGRETRMQLRVICMHVEVYLSQQL